MATTLYTLPQGTYGPVTDFKTPAIIPTSGAQSIQISTSISAADLADTTKTLHVEMECSPDGVQPYQTMALFNWQGGVTGKNGAPPTSPFMVFGIDGMIGEHCRLSITAPNPITMSASIVEI